MPSLNDEQLSVLEALRRFAHGPDPLACLTGPAGSGKTTLLRAFLDAIPDERPVRLLAPTGRAAHVLARHTGREASTIHRYLYNLDRIVEDRQPNARQASLRFEFSSGLNLDDDDALYVIDEASMLADRKQSAAFLSFGTGRLLSDLLAFVKPGETRRQIVFCGDPYQLPPVGEEVSPALSDRYLTEHFSLRPAEAALTEVVRQKADSGIYAHATALRRQIDSQRFTRFQITPGADVSRLPAHELAESYLDEVRQSSYDDVIAISFRNKTAAAFNREIRALRYGEEARDLRPGDRLIVVHNNYLHGLFNGELLEVAEVGEVAREVTGPAGSLRFREVQLHGERERPSRSPKSTSPSPQPTSPSPHPTSPLPPGEGQGEGKRPPDAGNRPMLLIETLLHTAGGGLTQQEQKLLWDDAGARLRPRVREVFAEAGVPQVLEGYLSSGEPSAKRMLKSALRKAYASLELPIEEAARLPIVRNSRPRGRSSKTRPAAAVKSLEQTTFRRLLRGDPYYNALRAKFGYAVTCHKAQGGEWASVFLALPGYSPMDRETETRWMYTAVTRARERMWFLE